MAEQVTGLVIDIDVQQGLQSLKKLEREMGDRVPSGAKKMIREMERIEKVVAKGDTVLIKQRQGMDRLNRSMLTLRATTARLGDAFKRFGGFLTSIPRRLRAMTSRVLGLKTAIVGLVGAFAVKSFIDFGANVQRALRRVEVAAVQTGATRKEIDALKASIAEVGRTTDLTEAQAAKASFAYQALGASAAETARDLSSMVKLASSTGTELEEVAEVTRAVSIAFGVDAKAATDQLAGAFLTTAANVERMEEGYKDALPTAKALGFSLEETNAVLAFFNDNLLQGRRAGTAFRNIIARLLSGVKPVTDALAGLNIKVQDFTDAQGKIRSYEQVFQLVGGALQGVANDAEKASIINKLFGLENLAAAQSWAVALEKNNNIISEYKRRIGEASDAQGLYNAVTDDVLGKMKELASVTQSQLLVAYRELEPTIKVVIESITNFIGSFEPEEIRRIANAFRNSMLDAIEAIAKGFVLLRERILNFLDSKTFRQIKDLVINITDRLDFHTTAEQIEETENMLGHYRLVLKQVEEDERKRAESGLGFLDKLRQGLAKIRDNFGTHPQSLSVYPGAVNKTELIKFISDLEGKLENLKSRGHETADAFREIEETINQWRNALNSVIETQEKTIIGLPSFFGKMMANSSPGTVLVKSPAKSLSDEERELMLQSIREQEEARVKMWQEQIEEMNRTISQEKEQFDWLQKIKQKNFKESVELEERQRQKFWEKEAAHQKRFVNEGRELAAQKMKNTFDLEQAGEDFFKMNPAERIANTEELTAQKQKLEAEMEIVSAIWKGTEGYQHRLDLLQLEVDHTQGLLDVMNNVSVLRIKGGYLQRGSLEAMKVINRLAPQLLVIDRRRLELKKEFANMGKSEVQLEEELIQAEITRFNKMLNTKDLHEGVRAVLTQIIDAYQRLGQQLLLNGTRINDQNTLLVIQARMLSEMRTKHQVAELPSQGIENLARLEHQLQIENERLVLQHKFLQLQRDLGVDVGNLIEMKEIEVKENLKVQKAVRETIQSLVQEAATRLEILSTTEQQTQFAETTIAIREKNLKLEKQVDAIGKNHLEVAIEEAKAQQAINNKLLASQFISLETRHILVDQNDELDRQMRFYERLLNAQKTFLNNLTEWLERMLEAKGVYSAINQNAEAIAKTTVKGLSGAGSNVNRAFDVAQSYDEGGVVNAITQLVLSNEKVKASLDKFFEMIFKMIDPFIDLFVPILDELTHALKPLVEAMKLLAGVLKPLINVLKDVFRNTGNALSQIVNGVTGFVNKVSELTENLGVHILGLKPSKKGGLSDKEKAIKAEFGIRLKEIQKSLLPEYVQAAQELKATKELMTQILIKDDKDPTAAMNLLEQEFAQVRESFLSNFQAIINEANGVDEELKQFTDALAIAEQAEDKAAIAVIMHAQALFEEERALEEINATLEAMANLQDQASDANLVATFGEIGAEMVALKAGFDDYMENFLSLPVSEQNATDSEAVSAFFETTKKALFDQLFDPIDDFLNAGDLEFQKSKLKEDIKDQREQAVALVEEFGEALGYTVEMVNSLFDEFEAAKLIELEEIFDGGVVADFSDEISRMQIELDSLNGTLSPLQVDIAELNLELLELEERFAGNTEALTLANDLIATKIVAVNEAFTEAESQEALDALNAINNALRDIRTGNFGEAFGILHESIFRIRQDFFDLTKDLAFTSEEMGEITQAFNREIRDAVESFFANITEGFKEQSRRIGDFQEKLVRSGLSQAEIMDRVKAQLTTTQNELDANINLYGAGFESVDTQDSKEMLKIMEERKRLVDEVFTLSEEIWELQKESIDSQKEALEQEIDEVERLQRLLNGVSKTLNDIQFSTLNKESADLKAAKAESEFQELRAKIFDVNGNVVDSVSEADVQAYQDFVQTYLQAQEGSLKSSQAFIDKYNKVTADLKELEDTLKDKINLSSPIEVLKNQLNLLDDPLTNLANSLGSNGGLADSMTNLQSILTTTVNGIAALVNQISSAAQQASITSNPVNYTPPPTSGGAAPGGGGSGGGGSSPTPQPTPNWSSYASPGAGSGYQEQGLPQTADGYSTPAVWLEWMNNRWQGPQSRSMNQGEMKRVLDYWYNVQGKSLSELWTTPPEARYYMAEGSGFRRGGMIGGLPHELGGTWINAQEGEFVMSRSAVNRIGAKTMGAINNGDSLIDMDKLARVLQEQQKSDLDNETLERLFKEQNGRIGRLEEAIIEAGGDISVSVGNEPVDSRIEKSNRQLRNRLIENQGDLVEALQ